MGHMALSKEPARMGIRYHGQGADIPSKGLFHTTDIYAQNITITVKRDSIVQVKNKPHVGTQYMRLFLAHWSTWLRTTGHKRS
jgi:hypothetical protein